MFSPGQLSFVLPNKIIKVMNKQIFIISLLNIQYHPKFGSKEFLPYFSIYIIYSVYSHIYLIQVQWTSKVLYQMSQMYLSITSLNLFTFSSLFLEIFLFFKNLTYLWPTCYLSFGSTSETFYMSWFLGQQKLFHTIKSKKIWYSFVL